MILADRKSKAEYLLIAGSLLFFTAVITKSAWISDDAYITFRTADNFIHGYGLRWNILERVQTYTHPLWMFLVTFLCFFTREMYFSVTILSLVISLMVALIFARKVAPNTLTAVFGIAILLFSKAFVDYSTSGLENPLTHLILILFLYHYIRGEKNLRTLFLLSLLTGLEMVNRLDAVLLFAPALVSFARNLRQPKGLRVIALGLVPFFLWEAFSVVYYGFPLPNSAYAKLHTGIDALPLARQGLYYLWNSLIWDPLTLVTITGAVLLSSFRRGTRFGPLALGLLLYLLYVIKIGGDFMSGRFLAAPFLASVIILSCSLATLALQLRTWILLFCLTAILGLAAFNSPVLGGWQCGMHDRDDLIDIHGIADERAWYFPRTGLVWTFKGIKQPSHIAVTQGLAARKRSLIRGPGFCLEDYVGFFGFYAGPRVYILDHYGLANAFVAHLNIRDKENWRVGHYEREIPDGFIQTLLTGRNAIPNKEMAQFAQKIAGITREPLWTSERWIAIMDINLGRHTPQ